MTSEKRRFAAVAVCATAFIVLLLAVPAVIPFDVNVTDLTSALRAPGEGAFCLEATRWAAMCCCAPSQEAPSRC